MNVSSLRRWAAGTFLLLIMMAGAFALGYMASASGITRPLTPPWPEPVPPRPSPTTVPVPDSRFGVVAGDHEPEIGGSKFRVVLIWRVQEPPENADMPILNLLLWAEA